MLDTAARLDQVSRFCDDLQALRRPVPGVARIDNAGTVTVGTYADGTPAGWPLWLAGHGRHTTVVGAAGSGKTLLLRSLLYGVAAADVNAQIIDLGPGQLTGLPHPTARDLDAARTVLATISGIARRDRTGTLRLLVIDDLTLLTRDPVAARMLHHLALVAADAGIAIVTSVQSPQLRTYGAAALGRDAEHLRDLLSQELVLQRIPAAATATMLLPHGPDLPYLASRLGDGTPTAGLGFLPRHRPTPFRAWLP
ncbi:hypothetical protein [Actinoplanes sp. G11-F43]|uniref:hypothetical protein n=1 Tax=Actinoplanes sp. G11-F43 TaxID=3424130 RepID=UPI003D32BBC2